MADYSPAVKQLLRANGYYRIRQGKGDHEIWYSPLSRRHFPVDSKILSRHTANGILKQAGLPKQFNST
jgi:predicted RNA binding protein YcfA (HicA-like mRNA interferase family)